MKEYDKDISFIIVNWNSGQLLCECLDSVFATVKSKSLEVIVVDNASTDGSGRRAKELFDGVELIENAENAGFARANNQAIRRATGRYVLLLNPDTVLHEGAVERLCEHLEANGTVGAAGPRLLNTDGTSQASTAGSFPRLGAVFNETFGLSKLFGGTHLFGGLYLRSEEDDAMEVDWISGACLMVKREVIDKAGMLNEGFFMYFEDQEWCFRIKRAGYKVSFVPASRVTHHGNRSLVQQEAEFLRNEISLRSYLKNFNGELGASLAFKLYLTGLYMRLVKAMAMHMVVRTNESRERVTVMRHALRMGRN